MKEWPKTLYRPKAEGGIEHRSFASEADVPEKEDWTDHKSAMAAAKPEPPVVPRDQKEVERLQKQITDLMGKLTKSQNDAQAERANAEAIRAVALQSQQRAADLEAFLGRIATDDCPAALKTAINDMLSSDEGKRKRAGRMAQAAQAA